MRQEEKFLQYLEKNWSEWSNSTILMVYPNSTILMVYLYNRLPSNKEYSCLDVITKDMKLIFQNETCFARISYLGFVFVATICNS